MSNLSKTEITIHAYNKNANKYTAKFKDFPAYKNKIISFQKEHIPKGANILDLGCGPGHNIETILERDNTCNITGIDLSAELINIAKKKHPYCNFLHHDIRLITSNTKYDVVIASFCIVHLSKTETAALISVISDILPKNGSLYLSFMEGDYSNFESTSFTKNQIFFTYYPAADIIEILNGCGITLYQLEKEDYREQDGSITTDIFIFARKK